MGLLRILGFGRDSKLPVPDQREGIRITPEEQKRISERLSATNPRSPYYAKFISDFSPEQKRIHASKYALYDKTINPRDLDADSSLLGDEGIVSGSKTAQYINTTEMPADYYQQFINFQTQMEMKLSNQINTDKSRKLDELVDDANNEYKVGYDYPDK